MKKQLTRWFQIAILMYVMGNKTAFAAVCTGQMNTSFGPYDVRYEVPDYDPAATEGYVRYWGPGTGAWTEGRYRWIYDQDGQKMILKMFFGSETNTCISFQKGAFSCRSDATPMTWDMVCE